MSQQIKYYIVVRKTDPCYIFKYLQQVLVKLNVNNILVLVQQISSVTRKVTDEF